MQSSSTPLLLFTEARIATRSIFRALTVDVAIATGKGQVWLDASRGNLFQPEWQRHVQNLAAFGRAHFELPWTTTDLYVSTRGEGIALDGASASLPLFVAWVALLSGKPLPDPFLATGVACAGTEGDLAPAPRAFARGKLAAGAAIAAQRGARGERVRFWIPRDSELDAAEVPTLDVRETPSLVDAVWRILGVPSGRPPGAGVGA